MIKMNKLVAWATIGFAIAIYPATGAQAADGAKVFKKCKACHAFGKNGLGPDLTGIVGRKAGSIKYKFSKALAAKADEGLVWTEENLDEFLAKPRDFIKKTKMTFAGLKKEDDRKAVIEYLKTK
ncbi:MAG: cytochrome c family protein [Rhodospirillales bacterium]|nr:cytochrome c family protein [Rhodospirillales bacterium]